MHDESDCDRIQFLNTRVPINVQVLALALSSVITRKSIELTGTTKVNET